MVTIAHFSDPHVGSPHFVPNLLNRTLEEINQLDPDLALCTGDLTENGLAGEYRAAMDYLGQVRKPLLAIPGNHDSRNVGYVHFERIFGARYWVHDIGPVRIVGADSSEPDLNEGKLGREHYDWLRESFDCSAELKIFAMHHHLIPLPATGRERSTVQDAGDVMELLLGAGVQLVLNGHKHVPHVWRLEHLYIANAGTCSSLKLRGDGKPCYAIIEYEHGQVRIHRKPPYGESTLIAHWDPRTGEQFHREFEPLFSAPLAPEDTEMPAATMEQH